MKLGEDDTCTFCKTHKEDLCHLFWTCEKTNDFWKKLKLWLIGCKAVPDDYDQNIATVLGLRPDKTKFKNQINFCLLNARYYIWSCRTANNQPFFQQFLDQHKTLYSLEFNEAKNLQTEKDPIYLYFWSINK